MRLHAIIAASALAISSAAAFAQSSPAGVPADPNTNQNVQPGPAATNPSDPSSASNPAARAPTAPPGIDNGSAAGASDGASTGESGSGAPAGIPADPNTKQNVQPGPSNLTPADPATGDDSGARAPTAP
jgi:hypothetical protein